MERYAKKMYKKNKGLDRVSIVRDVRVCVHLKRFVAIRSDYGIV